MRGDVLIMTDTEKIHAKIDGILGIVAITFRRMQLATSLKIHTDSMQMIGALGGDITRDSEMAIKLTRAMSELDKEVEALLLTVEAYFKSKKENPDAEWPDLLG